MGKLGGARPGAGRKPKSEKYKADIEFFEDQIRDMLPEVFMALKDSAVGLWREMVDVNGVPIKQKDGSPRYYKKAPDVKAAIYLVDRIMGTPVQKNEDVGQDKQLKIIIEYANPLESDAAEAASGATEDNQGID